MSVRAQLAELSSADVRGTVILLAHLRERVFDVRADVTGCHPYALSVPSTPVGPPHRDSIGTPTRPAGGRDRRCLSPACLPHLRLVFEPEAARELVEDGCEALVDWCGGPGPAPVTDDLDYILDRAVDSRRAKRLARKSNMPTVFVAEQWQRDDEGHVVIFVEGPPAPRAL